MCAFLPLYEAEYETYPSDHENLLRIEYYEYKRMFENGIF